MWQESIFNPELKATQEYGKTLLDLYYLYNLEAKKNNLSLAPLPFMICKVPFVLQALGIPSGIINLLPNKIPQMLNYKLESKAEQGLLTLEEMLTFPNIIADPDMIFRSNTKPNSLILCKELRRDNSSIISLKLDLQSSQSTITGYKKDNNAKEFFSKLYAEELCIYDGEQSEFFNELKTNTKGILTKTEATDLYKKNNSTFVAIFTTKDDTASLKQQTQVLSELGYKLISFNDIQYYEDLQKVVNKEFSIVCDQKNLNHYKEKLGIYPNTKKIGVIEDFLPQSRLCKKTSKKRI